MSLSDDYKLMLDAPMILHAICTNQTHQHIAKLVAGGADIEQSDGWGNTPLLHACNVGDYELAKLLLLLGADPNATNRDGYTPLGRVMASDRKLCELIKSAGGKLSTDNL